jgi:hypothetical protein
MVLPLRLVPNHMLADTVERIDSKVVNWLLSLPKWKQELVDPDGAVDMILFHSMAMAHG